MDASATRVDFALRGRVGVLTMRDAAHFNALSPPQVAALLAALDESRRQAARALVIASSAKHFCAGADIKEFLKGELLDPGRPPPATSPINLFKALIDDPRPVIAAVDGLAMGGGVELTLSCDLVLASDKARFALPELGLGLLPRTALVRLPEIVGRRKALELILTRHRLSAEEALAIGLVNRVVESAGLLDAAVALAEEIVSAPPGAIAAVKRTLGRVPPGDWEGLHGLLAHLDPAEWREGLTSFSEKRPPDYERFWAKPDSSS
jgi:enoyl-CoA hydratase/carnithine racemase